MNPKLVMSKSSLLGMEELYPTLDSLGGGRTEKERLVFLRLGSAAYKLFSFRQSLFPVRL